MKLSKAQQTDLETVLYFIPADPPAIGEQDVQGFFAYSDKGLAPDFLSPGYKALLEGKRWRGIHMQMWEEGIIDGSIPLYTLFVEESHPESVVEFAKRELFKGSKARLIDEVITNG